MTPEDFKTIKEIKDVVRYCLWIVEQKDLPNVSKYAAIVYQNHVFERMKFIENAFRKHIISQQIKDEKSLKQSTDKPGRKYI